MVQPKASHRAHPDLGAKLVGQVHAQGVHHDIHVLPDGICGGGGAQPGLHTQQGVPGIGGIRVPGHQDRPGLGVGSRAYAARVVHDLGVLHHQLAVPCTGGAASLGWAETAGEC